MPLSHVTTSPPMRWWLSEHTATLIVTHRWHGSSYHSREYQARSSLHNKLIYYLSLMGWVFIQIVATPRINSSGVAFRFWKCSNCCVSTFCRFMSLTCACWIFKDRILKMVPWITDQQNVKAKLLPVKVRSLLRSQGSSFMLCCYILPSSLQSYPLQGLISHASTVPQIATTY